jgi:hypothetical protein
VIPDDVVRLPAGWYPDPTGLPQLRWPTVFAAQAEQSVVSDATAIGARLEVVCPPTPPILVGQQFGCAATTTAGDHYDVLVSLQRVNGWIDWRVDDWGIYTLSR